MSEPTLLVEKDGHIVTLTMNRPHAKNAIDPEMLCRFADAWEEINGDDDVRAVIMTGSGGDFCAGADLDKLVSRSVQGLTPEKEYEQRCRDDASTIFKGLLRDYRLNKPLIAAIEGSCIAGGIELLMSTDIRVAGEGAKLGISEVRWSLFPLGGSTVRLRRQIPYTIAMEMLLTGDHYSAADALSFGLIGRVVPDGEALALLGTQPIDDGGSCSVRCQSWLFVVEPDGGTRRITDDSIYPVVEGFYDHSAGELTWTLEGRIVFAGDAGGQSYICSADLSDGAVSRLTRGGVQITGSSITPDGGRAAAAATSFDDLGDIVIYDLSDGGEKRLTAYNAEWLGQHPPAKVEKFTYERDGVELEARLYFPPGFDEAGSYPLVLDVHGGPHSAFYDAFYPLHQVFAGAGYVVLAINPQGSSTYGRDFACAVHAAWGGDPYEEVLTHGALTAVGHSVATVVMASLPGPWFRYNTFAFSGFTDVTVRAAVAILPMS